MPQETFLARQSFGIPHWLLVALVAALFLGFVPRGVRKAVESNTNKAEDWLPANYPESTDLRWFRDHFVSAQFVLTSWDGCTLGDTQRLRLLVQKLSEVKGDDGKQWFPRIITGPDQIADLTKEPSNLSRAMAITRLEGALVGPPKLDANGNSLGEDSRTTCMVAFLSEEVTDSNLKMRQAIDRITEIASEQCGIPEATLHMGGPPVDNVTIDKEGEKTLLRLAGLSGIVGFGLSFWCFRSWKLTWIVFNVAGISAGVSLALVYWFGVFEVLGLGQEEPHFGTTDAILMSMPAVVYVLGLSGAIHLINYYRDERAERGPHGAVERSVSISWGPCALAAFTTAVGLGSLGASDIVPIKKFGMFTAAGVMATVGVLFSILPVFLHLFPPKLDDEKLRREAREATTLPAWAQALAEFVTRRNKLVAVVCLAAMAFVAVGLTKTKTSVQLLKLLDQDIDLIHDYAWLEENLGNLVPMEMVIALTPDQRRSPDELPEGEQDRYRMTMYERMEFVRRIQQQVESLDPVSRAITAATFSPPEQEGLSGIQRRRTEYTTSVALETNRAALSDYLVDEKTVSAGVAEGSTQGNSRELWRVSARVAALKDIEYGFFVEEMNDRVRPVLNAYRGRDTLVAGLHEAEKRLIGSKLCVIFDGGQGESEPPDDTLAKHFYELLKESSVTERVKGERGKIALLNLSTYTTGTAEQQSKLRDLLATFDMVVTTSPTSAEALAELATYDVPLLNLAEESRPPVAVPNSALRSDAAYAVVNTGIVPLVYKTQRELLISLRESIGMATVLIACIMVILLRSFGGGLVSMIPNVFPIVMVFGMLGWLGVKIDIGIMMTASVALGVAVDDTIHFLLWFRRGIDEGMNRRDAVQHAFDRCATAMMQTTLIAGLGLAVFATSTFTPTQQFGYLMITMLGTALVGDLILLPALLSGPCGWFFEPGTPIGKPGPYAALRQEANSTENPAEQETAETSEALSESNDAPHSKSVTEEPSSSEPASSEQTPDETDETDNRPAVQAEPASSEEPVLNPSASQSTGSEGLSASNAALHAKLRNFRRTSSSDETDS